MISDTGTLRQTPEPRTSRGQQTIKPQVSPESANAVVKKIHQICFMERRKFKVNPLETYRLGLQGHM